MRRADAAFGVGLDDEAAEVGDQLVDLIDLLLPPGGDARIDGIEGWEAADDLRAGEIDGERHAHSPRAECVCDAREFMQHRRIERVQIGVDVVDGASVETDRREQAAILRYASEVLPDVTVGEEDGAPCVAAFDGSIEVIPLVDPANWCGGRFGIVGEGVLLGDLFEKMKDSVEFASAIFAGDYPIAMSARVKDMQGKALVLYVGR